MANAIIVVVLVLIIVFAVKNSAKHFRGEGGCCGGGSDSKKEPVLEKKLEGKKLGEKVLSISGMHCDHCVMSVTRAINRLEGASAKVSLKKNQAVVSYDRPISNQALRAAVETAGFKVTEIK